MIDKGYMHSKVLDEIADSVFTQSIYQNKNSKRTTEMGFEPTRAEHNGLAVHRLNHSATPSYDNKGNYAYL